MARGRVPDGGETMNPWPEIRCPRCGATVQGPEQVRVHCGHAGGLCTCLECGEFFAGPEIDYWCWLGLTTAPRPD
jgi:hypothetical protein